MTGTSVIYGKQIESGSKIPKWNLRERGTFEIPSLLDFKYVKENQSMVFKNRTSQ